VPDKKKEAIHSMSYELGKESEINVEQNIMVPILLLRDE
jgi:hypothetical protein